MDTLTAIVCFAVAFATGALILEIAMKRPETFREMLAGARVFAEAALPEGSSHQPSDRGPKMKGGHQQHLATA
ncbi:hypothetical protein [Dongia deserti]|uniref:hypothetical protein n=1 Tax=Dongia deserti TaxID=2268030 RepID=UPI000E648FD3|nr:hypothetical protein [Dongia deserti]